LKCLWVLALLRCLEHCLKTMFSQSFIESLLSSDSLIPLPYKSHSTTGIIKNALCHRNSLSLHTHTTDTPHTHTETHTPTHTHTHTHTHTVCGNNVRLGMHLCKPVCRSAWLVIHTEAHLLWTHTHTHAHTHL